MSDHYPLRPDANWFNSMRARYGDAVPDVDCLQFRCGLQSIVSDVYAQLRDLDLLRHIDFLSVVTQNADFIVINTRYHSGIFEDDLIALDLCIAHHNDRLNAACEHCGKPGSVIAKVGLEALLEDPSAVLGDRLLCSECYERGTSK